MGEFEDAYKKASEKIQSLRTRCQEQIDIGQTPLRAIKDLDAENKNLIEWHLDVVPKR